jgi:predicted CoA-binding protein
MAAKTLVLGASTAHHRYSNFATHLLLKKGHEILLVGKSSGVVEGHQIQKEWPLNEDIDTVTVYLAPHNQVNYYNDILESKTRRLIFNPGTENAELELLALEKGIEVEEACTLVLLNTNQY